MTDVPNIPNVVDLKPLPSSSTTPSYGVKEKNRPSKRYRGRRMLDAEGDGSGTVDVIVETIPLADVPEEKRTEALREISKRVRQLATRPMPHVLPILAAGELSHGDYYVVRPYVEGIPLEDSRGLPAAKNGKIGDLAEQLLTGLAALHAAGVAFGDLQLEDVQLEESGNEDSKPTLWLSGAEFGELDSITGNYLVRSSRASEHDSAKVGNGFSGDLRHAATILRQLAGGRLCSLSSPIRDSSLRKLVDACMSPSGDRPADGRKALQKLDDLRMKQRRNRIALISGAAALTAAIVFGGLWLTSKKVLAKTIVERDKAKQECTRTESERDSARAERDSARAALDRCEGRGPPLDVRREASELFHKYYVRNDSIVMPISDWLAAELKGRPLDEINAIEREISVFEHALQGKGSYSMQLDWAATSYSKHQGEDNEWLLTVYVDGDEQDSKTFQPGKQITQIWEFAWRPEQNIRLLVEGDWFKTDWTRDDLIDVTYSGKYSLWQLHQELQKLSRTATTVTGAITNFPASGPDRTSLKPMLPVPPKPPAAATSAP